MSELKAIVPAPARMYTFIHICAILFSIYDDIRVQIRTYAIFACNELALK